MSKLDDIHELVIRIDERQEYQGERIDELYEVVVKGNGGPSIVSRVTVLETLAEAARVAEKEKAEKAKTEDTRKTEDKRSRAFITAAKWSAGGVVLAALISLAVLL